MESEYINGATQSLQPAARKRHRPIGGKRIVEKCQVRDEIAGIRIGGRLTYGVVRRLEPIESPGRGRKAGVDPGNRAAVGLVAAIGRLVGRALCQCHELVGSTNEPVVQRELGTQDVELLKIEFERVVTL